MMNTSMADLSVDLGAIRHNYTRLRQRCGPEVKFLAVVKADAYGHGLVPVTRTLARAGADYFGVASLEEGLALRHAGVNQPVLLLLGLLPQESTPAVEADLDVALYRRDLAEALEAASRSQGKKIRVHLKVDTGMGRLGVLPEEVLPFLEELSRCPHLEVMGLISHLAAADQEDKTYTWQQLQEFQALLAAARQRGFPLPLSHIANSAALTDLPQAHFALVRPGIMLYGSPPAPGRPTPAPLTEAMALRSQVIQVKTMPPGASISYGRTYITGDWSKIAVVPVGYCNGYPRLLSNRGAVLIKGQRAPIRGRVCMNLIMVDITEIAGVEVGEPVTLMGRDQGERLCADDLAGWADTISYEIYCSLGSANPRRYLD